LGSSPAGASAAGASAYTSSTGYIFIRLLFFIETIIYLFKNSNWRSLDSGFFRHGQKIKLISFDFGKTCKVYSERKELA